jgi:6-phosphogluconolactonase
MKISNRVFALLFFAASLALLTFTIRADQTPADHTYLAFVGTYTHDTGSQGIYAYEFDTATGKLTPKGLAAETSNPSWLVIHRNGKWAYAANESGKQSSVSAFSIDPKSAKLTLLNKLPAAGEDPCYLSFDKTGKYLFVANYTSGNVVVLPILPDGQLGEHASSLQDAGTLGPNKERQDAPHAHWIEPTPGNRLVFAADLGLDRVLAYAFDATNGKLTPAFSHSAVLSPGTGPRHGVFSNDEKFLYVLGEMQSTVTAFVADGKGGYRAMQAVSGLPANFSGRNDAAEIALHPSGKWLFTSNRGHDSIAVFAVDPSKGITALGSTPTGGKEPRHFAIDPTGQFLLAENQNSNSIAVFRINPETGALSQVSITEGVPSPVCLTFLRTP